MRKPADAGRYAAREARGESRLDPAQLVPTKVYAYRRYGRHANLLAVGIGTKFKGTSSHSHRPVKQAGVICIQFFVTRKRSALPGRHRLPRFVYRRLRDGRIDRRRRVPTDVIAVRGIHAACAAGDSLQSNGERGLITLVFRNKAESGQPFYLISCSHVTGDVRRSPPAYPELISDNSSGNPLARTLANSTAVGGDMDYDIALARMTNAAQPPSELRVRGERRPLKSFLSTRLLQPGTGVSVTLRNRTARGTVETLQASAAITYSSGTFDVHNLWAVNVAVSPGDSGGLVYRDSAAAGIVVAASPAGWLWFQPLEPAMAFLNRISPVPVAVFKPSTHS